MDELFDPFDCGLDLGSFALHFEDVLVAYQEQRDTKFIFKLFQGTRLSTSKERSFVVGRDFNLMHKVCFHDALNNGFGFVDLLLWPTKNNLERIIIQRHPNKFIDLVLLLVSNDLSEHGLDGGGIKVHTQNLILRNNGLNFLFDFLPLFGVGGMNTNNVLLHLNIDTLATQLFDRLAALSNDARGYKGINLDDDHLLLHRIQSFLNNRHGTYNRHLPSLDIQDCSIFRRFSLHIDQDVPATHFLPHLLVDFRLELSNGFSTVHQQDVSEHTGNRHGFYNIRIVIQQRIHFVHGCLHIGRRSQDNGRVFVFPRFTDINRNLVCINNLINGSTTLPHNQSRLFGFHFLLGFCQRHTQQFFFAIRHFRRWTPQCDHFLFQQDFHLNTRMFGSEYFQGMYSSCCQIRQKIFWCIRHFFINRQDNLVNFRNGTGHTSFGTSQMNFGHDVVDIHTNFAFRFNLFDRGTTTTNNPSNLVRRTIHGNVL
mmetsp:Transcript_9251/g.13520  ORF Transcript_9251/g.13520 Transcript_9251/m.13520 type:complete len:481 (-) Transcript_9251:540-1982(-)